MYIEYNTMTSHERINPYKILEINKNSSQEEIKKAYRKQSMIHHPDRNVGNPESTKKFQKIQQAYHSINDPKKKQMFDMGFSVDDIDDASNGISISPEDIFRFMSGNLFSGGVGGSVGNENPLSGMGGMFSEMPEGVQVFHMGVGGPPPGMMGNFTNMPNIRHASPNSMRNKSNSYMQQSNEEIPVEVVQEKIKKPSSITKTISITLQQAYNGCTVPLEINRTITEYRQTHKETETLYVNIPKGVDDNEIILLKEKGNINNNVVSDVKVFIKIKNRTVFIREGLNLIFIKTITLKEALCGFTFNLEHIDGREFQINNKVGNIIEPNYKKVLKNLGMSRDKTTGDLIIEFKIKFPKELSSEQFEKLNEIL